MMIILKINTDANEAVDAITGWMFGEDTHTLRRQCETHVDSIVRDLAPILYRMEFPSSGKHRLTENFLMIVGV